MSGHHPPPRAAARACQRLALALALGGALLAAEAPAASAATAIDGKCGIHRGKIVVPFLHRYHVRIGVKASRPGGTHRCRGLYHRQAHALGPYPHGGWWSPFDLRSWNWSGIVDVSTQGGVTAATCATFGAAMFGALPSGGLSTLVTVGAAAGCARGAYGLSRSVHDDFFAARR